MTPAFTERQADLLAELVHLERARCELDQWGIPGIKAAIIKVCDKDLASVAGAFIRASRAPTNRTPAVAAEAGAHWDRPKSETPQPPTAFPTGFRPTDPAPPESAAQHLAQLREIARSAPRPTPKENS